MREKKLNKKLKLNKKTVANIGAFEMNAVRGGSIYVSCIAGVQCGPGTADCPPPTEEPGGPLCGEIGNTYDCQD